MIRLFFFISLLTTVFAHGASHVDVTTYLAHDEVRAGSTSTLAVRFILRDHWHIYWANPGDSGLATKIDLDLPAKWERSAIQWPVPHRFEDSGIVNFGWDTEAVLQIPITVSSDTSVGRHKIQAKIAWLECREICIPGKLQKEITVRVGTTDKLNTKDRARFEAAGNQNASRLPELKLSATKQGEKLVFVLDAPELPSNTSLFFFPFEQGQIENSAQNWTQTGTTFTGSALLVDPALGRIHGVLASPTGGSILETRGIDVVLPVQAGSTSAAPVASSAGSPGFLTMLLFAFLGGLLLNLMPCVFPVLSIKILGFVEHASGSPAEARRHGYAFGIGVLVSFWTLSGVLLALRAGGDQFGWGFQLQSPRFLAGLILLLYVLSLSFLGIIEIGNRLMSFGSSWTQKEGYAGSFFSGVLATIVATPCTAPFMGSAVGFALAQPPVVGFLVFTSLAVGMAAPYVVLTASPALLRFLPRPGRWMESLKEFMAFPLLATVGWLLWVYGQTRGIDGVTVQLFALLILSLGIWVYTRWGGLATAPKTRMLARLAVFVLSVGAIILSLSPSSNPSTVAQKASSEEQWVPYSENSFQDLRKQGKPIFVDFTAAWCLTCKVNEKAVFSSNEVWNTLKAKNVVLVKADWTDGNPEITRFLAAYNRSGVPFYLLFPGGSAEPQILPELLTPSVVLEALGRLPGSD